MSRTLTSVATFAEMFCNPSRGATSVQVTSATAVSLDRSHLWPP